MLFQLMQWEQKNTDGNNAFINKYMTICGSHSQEFVYALDVSCTFIVHWYMCVEVEMKGLVVSVFFPSVSGEHLTWHKKLTSAGNLPVCKAHCHFFLAMSIWYS